MSATNNNDSEDVEIFLECTLKSCFRRMSFEIRKMFLHFTRLFSSRRRGRRLKMSSRETYRDNTRSFTMDSKTGTVPRRRNRWKRFRKRLPESQNNSLDVIVKAQTNDFSRVHQSSRIIVNSILPALSASTDGPRENDNGHRPHYNGTEINVFLNIRIVKKLCAWSYRRFVDYLLAPTLFSRVLHIVFQTAYNRSFLVFQKRKNNSNRRLKGHLIHRH